MVLRFSLLLCLLLAAAGLAACTDDSTPAGTSAPAPPAAEDSGAVESVPPLESERLRAFEVALDSLNALVRTLERINGPITAWNQAEEVARLLRYLETNRDAFALNMTEDEAVRYYPNLVGRLNTLETRRADELERIDQDPAAMRVLLEEIAKANEEL